MKMYGGVSWWYKENVILNNDCILVHTCYESKYEVILEKQDNFK